MTGTWTVGNVFESVQEVTALQLPALRSQPQRQRGHGDPASTVRRDQASDRAAIIEGQPLAPIWTRKVWCCALTVFRSGIDAARLDLSRILRFEARLKERN